MSTAILLDFFILFNDPLENETQKNKNDLFSNTMFCLNVVAYPSTSFTIAFTYFISEIVLGKNL